MLLAQLFFWGKASVFKSDEHCVAYQASKRMFLFKSVQITGKNCSVEAELIGSDPFQIKIAAPIAKFASGEPDRDVEVLKLLEADELLILSEPFSTQTWQTWLQAGKGVVRAEWRRGSQKHPLKVSFKLTKQPPLAVQGRVLGKLSDYGIVPPSVGGGVIVQADDKLDLFFQLISSKTKGYSQLLQKK